jgi:vitamin-K-epoxide reductase (warfarin-sensitive)
MAALDNFETANFYIRILASAGVLIAAYSLYVKARFAKDKTYRAMCDLSDNISCTRVMASKYGTNFGINIGSTLAFSNSFLGILFYLLQFALSKIGSRSL